MGAFNSCLHPIASASVAEESSGRLKSSQSEINGDSRLLSHDHALEAASILLKQRRGIVDRGDKSFSTAVANWAGKWSGRWNRSRSVRSGDSSIMTHEEALAAVDMLLQEHGGGVSKLLPFDRSTSTRNATAGGKKEAAIRRSTSSRPRSLSDSLIQTRELMNHNIKMDNLESNHFVLVHGGGFGAWCWYKTIALLESSGFKVDAIDLAASGINSIDPNDIKSFSQYVKPLTDFFEKLGKEKVILVGHDFGGSCISYSMEAYPSNISKSIFICAAMLENGQSTLHMLSQKDSMNDLMQKAHIFLYANGNNHPASSIDLDKSFLKDLLFNCSPAKDVALATVSLRPIPFAPLRETLVLTDSNYGSVRRFYIETTEDNSIPLPLQRSICASNPPEKVFQLKGADHSPFFSKPQALHKLLLEIAYIPPPVQTNHPSSQ